MIKFGNYEIELEEKNVYEDFGVTVLYFIGPKEMVIAEYPEAESTEISIEFPTSIPNAEYATVMISPTSDGMDYDWSDADFPLEEIEKLIAYGVVKGENK